MHVVDALQAASVISTNIGVLVEVKAGSDFELANARTALYPPHVLGVPLFQSGRLLNNSTADVSELTVGESVQSLKQLISIPKITPAALTATKQGFLIPPWFYQPRPSGATPAPTTHVRESFGFGGMIAACYAFVRGGTDFHVYPVQDSSSGMYVTVRESSAILARESTTQGPARQPFSNNPLVVNTQGSLHVRLPAYQACVRYFSSCLNSAATTGAAWSFNGIKNPSISYSTYTFPSLFYAMISSPSALSAFISRNAADDAYAGGFLGPPPLLLLSTNTATTLYDLESDSSLY